MQDSYSPAAVRAVSPHKPRKRNKQEEESTSDMELDERVAGKEWRRPASSKPNLLSIIANREVKTPKKQKSLSSWVEGDMLRKLSAIYCKLKPPPRSTIAAAFSPDGQFLASTHGDHTVKIICCRTGECLNVLPGHRRTPWVVTFHPRTSHILASGSLDHEVRIWNAKSSDCMATYEFQRPIASLAFHALGDIIGIASGHQLYIWDYSRSAAGPGQEGGSDSDSGEGGMMFGGGPLPKPVSILRTKRSLRAVHFHPFGVPLLLSAEVNDQDSTQDLPQAHCTTQWREALSDYNRTASFQQTPSSSSPDSASNPASHGGQPSVGQPDAAQQQQQPAPHSSPSTSGSGGTSGGSSRYGAQQSEHQDPPHASGMASEAEGSSRQQRPAGGRRWQGFAGIFRPPFAPFAQQPAAQPSDHHQRGGGGNEDSNGAAAAALAAAEAAAAATAAMSQDMPCTVRLRLWPFDVNNPYKPLEKEILEIRHAVLCSEMGAHFSPCGKFLATCIACHPPPDMVIDNTPLGPVTALFYELRIYSMEAQTFGQILHARPIRAAHCLTSIRFSPTSEHLLLAYGRRHMTLLQSIVADSETGSLIPIHTILEIYRVADMQLVRVLPSAEDEVNVACFHPWAGGGIAYGTKEGKLRLLRHEKFDCRDWKDRPVFPSIEDELLQGDSARDSDAEDEIYE